jgi:hypothetical protein
VLKRDSGDLEFLRATECQKRGALHYHVIMWSSEPLDLNVLRQLAIRCGFGHEVDLSPVQPGSRKHARYVAKYVTKACDLRDEIPWVIDDVDEETGEIRRLRTVGRYRTWSASRGWGLTMREVRLIARVAAQRAADLRRSLDELTEPLWSDSPDPAGVGPFP